MGRKWASHRSCSYTRIRGGFCVAHKELRSPMARCRVDPTVNRVDMQGFTFPLGVYPVEAIEPKQGYTMAFEPADEGPSDRSEGNRGEDEGGDGLPDEPQWEEWPDRYVFDILVPSQRIEPLCRSLLSMLPGRIYPILDFLGQDEWREVDPYVSYDLLGMDRFLEALRRFRGFFYEDGLVGFGAMGEEPAFMYLFVDEHKVVTVRAETGLKERVEAVLAAYDLEQVEEIRSADSATHEHRTVLDAPDDHPELLTSDEIVEVLRDEWRLVLNIDPERNVDEDGRDIGITGWRCIVRYDPPIPESELADLSDAADEDKSEKVVPSKPDEAEESVAAKVVQPPPSKYAEVFVTADSLNRCTELVLEALEQLLKEKGVEIDEDSMPEPVLVQHDRWGTEDFVQAVLKTSRQTPDMEACAVVHASWLN